MISEPKTVVVVPTIRADCIKSFLSAWECEFSRHTVIIVEDNPEKSFEIAAPYLEHYSWSEIDHDLGEDSWVIPRRTDCIRSYGYWKAYQKKPEMIVTLDDDCFPVEGQGRFLQTHWERLNEQGVTEAWVTTLEKTASRGVPYFTLNRMITCILNHGLWESAPDFDAPTQLLQSRNPHPVTWVEKTIPVGSYFPMCGMNLAFRPEAVPALYFLLMGAGHQFDRFGDIWAGIILKKIADHLGYCVNSGRPAVKHLRASNVWANLRKESMALEANETFWNFVDRIVLSGTSFQGCYREIADKVELHGEYWLQLRKAMRVWADFFSR